MPFDFAPAREDRVHRGRRNHHTGLAAEAAVARHYERAGYRICARRWRGRQGEIDLILETGAGIVLVEVKSAATHHAAWESFGRDQFQRICAMSDEFAHDVLGNPFVDRRLDLALVDGQGRIEIMESFLYD